jgi:hypothetical protein
MESREKLEENMNVHLAGRDYVVVMTNYMGNNASIDRASRAAGKKPNLEAACLKEIGVGCKENQKKTTYDTSPRCQRKTLVCSKLIL